MKSLKSVSLPILIHRDEKAIESEVSNLRRSREEVATALRGFIKKFCAWTQDATDGIPRYMVDLVCDRDVENELLRIFLQKKGVDYNLVKLDKAKEIYHIPDYSDVVFSGTNLANRYDRSTLMQCIYDGSDEITTPEVTKAEKEAIIEKHSVYIRTEETHTLYRAISALCDYGNILNTEVGGFSGIGRGQLGSALPSSLFKYLVEEKKDRGGGGYSLIRTFSPKYELFRDK